MPPRPPRPESCWETIFMLSLFIPLAPGNSREMAVGERKMLIATWRGERDGPLREWEASGFVAWTQVGSECVGKGCWGGCQREASAGEV